jgi:cation transport ATPase
MGLVRLDDFTCYEGGGIGAIIRGEHVLTGTAGFMNLMGIRIPSQVNLKNSVFTAIGDKLVAIFSVNYVPVNSVRGALMSILGVRISMLLHA